VRSKLVTTWPNVFRRDDPENTVAPSQVAQFRLRFVELLAPANVSATAARL
jgi:hypothetical protein